MPKLNFPASPSPGTLYTENGNTWKWNGTSWISFNSLDLTNQVSGALGITNGGTGYTSNAKGDILVGTGLSWYKLSYSASANDVLTVDTSQPSGLKWASVPPAAATSVQVSATDQNSVHFPTFVDNLNGSGLALSTDSALFYNPSTNRLNVGGLGVSGDTSLVGNIYIYESTGSSYVGFRSVNLIGSTIYTFPVSSPATGNSVLQSSSDGILTWVPMVASGGGSGNVYNGNQGQLAYYYSPGTGVTGSSNLSYDDTTSTLSTNTFSGNLSGTAVTSTNFYGNLSGTATTANNIRLSTSTNNSNHFFTFVDTTIPLSQSGFGLSISSSIYYNPSTDILTVGQVSGNLSGTAVTSTNFYGNLSGTATTAQNIKLSNGTDNSNHFLTFSNVSFPVSQSGYGLSVNSNIYYNPSTGVLTVGQISGNLSGTAVTSSDFYGNLTGTASTSSSVKLSSSSKNSNHYLIFAETSFPITQSSFGLSVNSSIYYNPNSDTLTVGLLSGNLSGSAVTASNFYGNLSGTAITSQNIYINSAVSTNAEHKIIFTPQDNVSGSAISVNSTLVYNPSSDKLTASAIAITSNAQSTSTTIGALTVAGGVGIGGSINLGNRLSLYNGSNYISFLNSGSASTIYTLPSNSPQGSGTSVLSSTQDGIMSWVPMTATSSSGGTVNTGVASRLAYYQSSGAAVTDTYGINYNNSGTASTFTIFGGASLGNTVFIVQALSTTSVKVGIGLTNPAYELEVNGEISATSKSFVIDHPTKSGMKLRYGSLEGPENGVYIRGILHNENIIETPDYWKGLVDHDTFTVNLTPIGNYQQLYIEKIEDFKVHVGSAGSVHCYYYVLAERKDVDKLIVEY